MTLSGGSIRVLDLDYRTRAVATSVAALLLVGLLGLGSLFLLASWSLESGHELREARAAAANSTRFAARQNSAEALGPQLFPGAIHTEVVAQLHGAVRALADKHQSLLSSVTVLPPARKGGLTMLSLRCSLLLPESELSAFLTDIMNAAPTLVVEGMEIVAPRRDAGALRGTGSQDSRLSVTLDIAGFSRSALVEGGRR